MCSIYGYLGTVAEFSDRTFATIQEQARSRGRDGGRTEDYHLANNLFARLGNWRAAPTTEVHVGPLQPYEGMVHNGTIANDAELAGGIPYEIDSQVLAYCLDRSDLAAFRDSLGKIKGSYALAAVSQNSVYLARTYKPLYYARIGGGLYFSSLYDHLAPVIPYGQAPVELKPYSVLDLLTGESLPLPRPEKTGAVVVCSGGLDSTTVAWLLKSKGLAITLLHFLYGCRAEGKEVERVSLLADLLGAKFVTMRLPYAEFSSASLLNSNTPIAEGIAGAEYAHEWVPARNLVFISLATAYAEANGLGIVALGANLEESGAYPDNEEEMYWQLNRASCYFVSDGYALKITSPIGHLMKHEVVNLGLQLGVPYQHTWSCYLGGEVHCGKCGPCFMRREAFARNGRTDPTQPQAKETI